MKPPASQSSAIRARAVPSELLELLKVGRITPEVYLLAKVAEAVAPFRKRLRPRDIAFLRTVLEHELESDPVLGELRTRLMKVVSKPSGRT